MNKKIVLVALLSTLAFMSALQIARAATITSVSLDKTSYLAGQTGYILVSVYNDKSEKIRVTELTATINYYYADSTVYLQKFFTSATLPDEITAGQTETYQVSISLPTNIASGYTNPTVEVRTDVWHTQDDRWVTSDRPTNSQLKLYIESPYKQQYETSQAQLQDQKTTSANLNNNVNMLAVTTIAFAGAAAFLMFQVFARRAKPIPQP